MFQGCCIKVFSRKQECPALSGAAAELCAMKENSKELVSSGMLLESILDGDHFGNPAVYNRDSPFGFAQRRGGRDQYQLDGRVVATRPAHRTSCEVHSNAGEEEATFAREHPRTSKPK